MDVGEFLEPRSDDQPSGENLEYDQDFTALELAAQPGEERQMGDDVIEGAEPDWRDVTERALGVLGRAHDLRAASHLALAQLKLRGLPGFAEVLSYARGCLDRWWDTCHPQLDADDDDDPTMRINAVLTFADADRMLRALRSTPLTESRGFGRFSLRDILIAEGEIAAPASGTVADTAAISAAFQDTSDDIKQSLLEAARQARDDVRAIDAIFTDRTPGQGPDLDALSRLLYQIQRRLEDYGHMGAPAGGSDGGADDHAPQTGAPQQSAAPAQRGGGGPISTRQDVVSALDQIIAYYQRNEPSSPLVILIERAKGLVGADFLTIVRELAPDSVTEINRLGGIKSDEY